MPHSPSSTLRSSPPPPPPTKSPARHTHHERAAHHQRRKSGGQLLVSDRKASRPAPLNRRTTPQFITKVGPGWSGARNIVNKAEKDGSAFNNDDEDWRLSGEGFLQYCASCEKQLDPHEKLSTLYCSPACRKQDLQPTSIIIASYNLPPYGSQAQMSPPLSPYFRTNHLDSISVNRDIIPQFSPTQFTTSMSTRPRSYFNSAPHPRNSPPTTPSSSKSDILDLQFKSPVTTSSTDTTSSTPSMERQSSINGSSTTALELLRELAVALPPPGSTRGRDSRRHSRALMGNDNKDMLSKRSSLGEYPPSPSASSSSPATPLTTTTTTANCSSSNASVWNYLPRTLSMASVYARDIISASHAERYPGGWTSPNSSVKDSSSSFLSSFGGVSGKGPDDQYGGNAVKLLPAISLGGMDRPLPPRSGGYGYGGRPKSVDLVTPVNFI